MKNSVNNYIYKLYKLTIILFSSKDTDEERVMHLKSDNVEVRTYDNLG